MWSFLFYFSLKLIQKYTVMFAVDDGSFLEVIYEYYSVWIPKYRNYHLSERLLLHCSLCTRLFNCCSLSWRSFEFWWPMLKPCLSIVTINKKFDFLLFNGSRNTHFAQSLYIPKCLYKVLKLMRSPSTFFIQLEIYNL